MKTIAEQLPLDFGAAETPLHRERNRPKRIKPKHWSEWIDRICVRGGVRFTVEAVMADFRACCPQHASVEKIEDLTLVHLSSWEREWDWFRPWST